MLSFTSHGHLTLGIELEIQILDPHTLDLAPVASSLLARLPSTPKIKPEIFQGMIEICTGVCRDVREAEADLKETLQLLGEAARAEGVLLAATGTHPFARYDDSQVFPSERYQTLIDRNQWIARRLMIFGLHVHIGLSGGDRCIQFNNFFLHLIPHLLALSASSPFWQGSDTGLASCRPTIFESCPTAGHPNRFVDWNDFSGLCAKLVQSGAIASHKDLWWDLRPSPDFGTLEIRSCDGTATLAETLALSAFIHALAHWYDTHTEYNPAVHAPYMWMMRENKWRAMRHGLDTEIIADDEPRLVSLRDDIGEWFERLAPIWKQLGYEPYAERLAQIMRQGTSQQRQLARFKATQSVQEVVRRNAEEFMRGEPIYD